MPLTELPDPARIRIRHRVEWLDTDAAGIYHWSTVARFAEAAEAALHNALAITEITFGSTPRLSVSFDFARPLRFNDEVTVDFAVEPCRTLNGSLRDGRPRRPGPGRGDGCDHDLPGRPSMSGSRPWPEDVRAALAAAGEQHVSGGRPSRGPAPRGRQRVSGAAGARRSSPD